MLSLQRLPQRVLPGGGRMLHQRRALHRSALARRAVLTANLRAHQEGHDVTKANYVQPQAVSDSHKY